MSHGHDGNGTFCICGSMLHRGDVALMNTDRWVDRYIDKQMIGSSLPHSPTGCRRPPNKPPSRYWHFPSNSLSYCPGPGFPPFLSTFSSWRNQYTSKTPQSIGGTCSNDTDLYDFQLLLIYICARPLDSPL